MIKHIHLEQCHSTQDVLKEQFNSDDEIETILVSCENQISGRGRGENNWNCMRGTLCFSINIPPHPLMSFTAIELSVIISDYFELKKSSLLLKWPNDLWNKNHKKCAGILVQGSHKNLFAGVGINLFSNELEFGGVFEEEHALDKKSIAKEIANFIMTHRIHDVEILKKKWLERCIHINKNVTIIEGEQKTAGNFIGIGDFGEALIETSYEIKKIYNGSLRIN
jgi:BirA family biotin operon repressor/biotin-[acetyl-CoA-carboxylase] ligase